MFEQLSVGSCGSLRWHLERCCAERAENLICGPAGTLLPAQGAGAVMVDNATIAATKGVTVSPYSNSTYLYSWNATGAFDTQADALAAFLKALSKVRFTAYLV